MRSEADDGAVRPTKTWGPFTGRQLTTIVCVIAVTLLLPVAAWSATSSHVVVHSGKITIDSPVAANVAQRSQFISSGGESLLPVSPALLLSPPSGKGLVITTLLMAFSNVSAGGGFAMIFTANTGACSNGVNTQEWSLPAGNGSMDAPINPGYVVPPGKVLCARSAASATMYASAYGYVVAPGTVPNPPS